PPRSPLPEQPCRSFHSEGAGSVVFGPSPIDRTHLASVDADRFLRLSVKARKVLLEEEIADAGADVDQEVRDDQWPYTAPPDEDRAEEDAEQRVGKEAAPALVQVVRTAEDRADDDRGDRGETELAEPSDEIPGD